MNFWIVSKSDRIIFPVFLHRIGGFVDMLNNAPSPKKELDCKIEQIQSYCAVVAKRLRLEGDVRQQFIQ